MRCNFQNSFPSEFIPSQPNPHGPLNKFKHRPVPVLLFFLFVDTTIKMDRRGFYGAVIMILSTSLCNYDYVSDSHFSRTRLT